MGLYVSVYVSFMCRSSRYKSTIRHTTWTDRLTTQLHRQCEEIWKEAAMAFSWNEWGKSRESSICIFSVVGEIRTGHLLNAIPKDEPSCSVLVTYKIKCKLFQNQSIVCATRAVIWSYKLLKERKDLCDRGDSIIAPEWAAVTQCKLTSLRSRRTCLLVCPQSLPSSQCYLLQFSLSVIDWLKILLCHINYMKRWGKWKIW
jgi:hypothetical protein